MTIESEDKYKVPKSDIRDTAHLIFRAALSLIPHWGGSLSEIFKALLKPSINRRTENWMNEIGQGLLELEKRQKLDYEELSNNDDFITILIQASWTAVRNHQEEKIKALRNAVINTASNIDLTNDMQLLFIRYIDELTPTHITILKFFIDNELKIARVTSFIELHQAFVHETSMIIDEMYFKLICEDLKIRCLVRISESIQDFPGINIQRKAISFGPEEGDNILVVSKIGKDFIKYITLE